MANKKGSSMGTGMAVGASALALGAAAYLIFGPEGKKHRKDLKSWMVQMKGDVMEKMENAKDVSGEVYENILKEVEEKYKKMKHVSASDVAAEIALLKKNWHSMSTAAKKKTKPVKKSVPKKAARKSKAAKK